MSEDLGSQWGYCFLKGMDPQRWEGVSLSVALLLKERSSSYCPPPHLVWLGLCRKKDGSEIQNFRRAFRLEKSVLRKFGCCRVFPMSLGLNNLSSYSFLPAFSHGVPRCHVGITKNEKQAVTNKEPGKPEGLQRMTFRRQLKVIHLFTVSLYT